MTISVSSDTFILGDRYVHNCALSLCNAQLSVHYAVIMHSWEMIEDIDNAQWKML